MCLKKTCVFPSKIWISAKLPKLVLRGANLPKFRPSKSKNFFHNNSRSPKKNLHGEIANFS